MKTSVTSLEPPKQSSLEIRSFSDAPIQRNEDDRLNRLPFAKQIASLIDFPQLDQQVIGLYGEWGEGKTSVLNLALNEYRSMQRRIGQEPPIIVHFCPWEYSAQTNITKALFSTIASAVYNGTCIPEEVRNAIAKGFLFLSEIVSVSLSCTNPLVAPGIIAAQNNIGKHVEEFLKEPSLEKTKKDLNKQLTDLSRRIIVVIDDVDRLLHPEIRELIRSVKANGDLPNLTWIVLCDRNIVAKALTKDLDTNEDKFGHRFLDKIIPIGLDLPKTPQAVLFDEFQHLLDSSSSLIPDNARKELVNDPMESVRLFCVNMRNVKRLVNSVLISLRMFSSYEENADFPSIHFGDFANLEAWRLFEPSFFNAIYQNKYLLLTDGVKIEEAKIQAIVDASVSKDLREHARVFIKNRFGFEPCTVFPEDKERHMVGRVGHLPQTRYRLANSKYFELYFSFRLNSVDISRSDENRFLASISDSAEMARVLLDLDKSGKLPSLLYYFETPPVFSKEHEQLNYLEALWLAAEMLDSNVEYWKIGPLDFSRQTRLMRCSLYFLQKFFPDSKSKLRAFQTIMERNVRIISQPLELISLDYSHADNDEPGFRVMDEEHEEIVANICLERLSKMHETGALSSHPNSFDLRIRWRQVAGTATFLKATEADFSRFPDAYANLIPFTTIAQNNDGKFYTVNLDALEEGCDIPELLRFLREHPSPISQFQEMRKSLEFAFDAKKNGNPYETDNQIQMICELRRSQSDEA